MFAARSVELIGGFELTAPVETAFELFSPLGEKLWVPGWDPELIHPPGASWERGLIFRTHEERGEAIWVITVLDRPHHQVEYLRVEAGRYVAKVSVHCRANGEFRSDVRVTYSFVGLSEHGNQDIVAISAQNYQDKMRRWQGWINQHLASRSA